MPTQFGADDYFQASIERMQQARSLFEDGESYALSMYCSGLAVECLLRAFRWLHDRSFDGRHDLRELLKASRFIQVSTETLRDSGYAEEDRASASLRLHAAMTELDALWMNSLRFVSESKLKRYLFESGRLHGIKGDGKKWVASSMLDAAYVIVEQGALVWRLKKKSKPR